MPAVLLGVVMTAAPGARAQGEEQVGSIDVSAPESGVLDVQIGTAIEALRGRVVGQSGEILRLETTTREILVRAPAGFSAPLGACIQVSGEVSLSPVFKAEQVSLVPPEERASSCPPEP
jgi:hypothetical protein